VKTTFIWQKKTSSLVLPCNVEQQTHQKEQETVPQGRLVPFGVSNM
jgi:hypothetical protein